MVDGKTQETSIKIVGTAKSIYYSNAVDGFYVLRCFRDDTSEYFKAVGYMPSVNLETVYEFEGRWVNNKKTGLQFEFDMFDEVFERNEEGIVGFLSGCKGIGPVYAKRIFDTFGMDTLEIIETVPERLLEVQGIGEGRLEKLKANWEERRGVKNIMVFFHGYGITSGQAVRIYKQYGDKSISMVTENPYRLVDDIWGFGFITVDGIAQKMGVSHDKFERLRSGMMYVLDEASKLGHCFILWDQLLKDSNKLLNVELSLLVSALDRMSDSKDIMVEAREVVIQGRLCQSTVVYLRSYYFAERGVAERLTAICSGPSGRVSDDTYLLNSIQRELHVTYDPAQLKAISMAINYKLLVLTGGPGTGKTKTVEGILAAFARNRAKILLAAPTGRAAKRLSETTGKSASTIHRLLGVKDGNVHSFKHDEKNPLEGDVLVVDECSMIDINLMNGLLKAVPKHMVVILVGDVDQLPSVGPGNVLRDIIECGCFPVVRLTKVFRQAESSGIIMNAHSINHGKMPVVNKEIYPDFFFMNMKTILAGKGVFEPTPDVVSEKATEVIVDLVANRLPRYFNVSSSEIQVLSPRRSNSGACVTRLNTVLQQRLNPGEGVKCGSCEFRVHDRVMQRRNNYDKAVFNGDMGTVVGINKEEESLDVKFSADGKPVTYDFSELNELDLAYATTIHKSQGSEYPVVVIPILTSHWIMLQRNLLYTGITRAKKGIVLVGTHEALNQAIRNTRVQKRNTALKERIREQFAGF